MGQIAGLLLMTERPARAYVDPGTGLFFFQMLGASLAGGFFFMRHKLRRLFRRDPDEGPPHQSVAATATAQPTDLTSAPPSRPTES